MILLGDVGGTNSRLQLTGLDGTVLHDVCFRTNEFRNFEELLQVAKEQLGEFEVVSMGVAGPVKTGEAIKLPLVNWPPIDPEKVKRRLCLKRILLVNDMVAIAYGVNSRFGAIYEKHIGGSNLIHKNILVVTIGTSVGKIRYQVAKVGINCMPSEACHTILPIGSRGDAEVLSRITSRFGLTFPLNCSEVISGQGIERLFWALNGIYKPVNEIAQISPHNESFQELKRRFNQVFGTVLHCWILDAVPCAMVFVAGGVVEKLDIVDSVIIRQCFNSQKMLREMSESAEIRVVKDDQLGLVGAFELIKYSE